MAFVELHRSFIPLSKDQEARVDAGRYWGGRLFGWLDWEALRRRKRVVLLAEAYSGKSEEFRHQQELLASEGRPAFFIRIEELAEQGFEAALDSVSAEAFEAWRTSTEDGWFFLNSIDEARLNRKNFESALKRFAREAGTAIVRAHVFVSCRVTDWKGPEDRRAITRWLPSPQRPAEQVLASPSGDRALLDPIFEKKGTESKKQDDEKLSELLVVQLAPLDERQYRTLAKEVGVTDVAAFVAAIGGQGLDAFTERPGDLVDLAGYWITNRRFGSLTAMVEHGIVRKLNEVDPHRHDNAVLSPEKARAGAERIASALTLGKSFTLRAPGHDPDPSLASGALDPALILPDWTDAERAGLLRRGLFAPSTYGRVRFHHRSSQEYLTAKWFDGLLRSGCPRSEVHGLVFANRYGVATVVPSLRPAAAWLSLWNPDVLDEVVSREPLVLIQHGDPASLSIDVRKRMLATYAVKQASGEISDDRLNSRTLWMFAHPDLADAIAAAWQANSREDFRLDLLRLIRDGGVKGAAKLAAQTVSKVGTDELHRVVALQAAAACDDGPTLKSAATSLKKAPKKTSAFLACSFCEALYPKYLTTTSLLRIIERSQPPKPRAVDGFAYKLDKMYDAAPDHTSRSQLLTGITGLCLTPPFVSEYQRISQRHKVLAEHLHDIARQEVQRLAEGALPLYLINMLMVVERAERGASLCDREKPTLHQLVPQNVLLNRALFWADVAEERANSARFGAPTRYWQVFLQGGKVPLWSFSDRDLPWLYKDLTDQPLDDDRRIALSAIVDLLKRNRKFEAEVHKLRTLVGSSQELARDLAEYITPPPPPPEFIRDRQLTEEAERQHAVQTEHDKASWVKFRDEVQSNPDLLRDPSHLTSWKAGIYRLQALTRWLWERTSEEPERAAREWRLLEEGFGRAVAEAYRDGMKALWRVVKPERPKRTPGGAVNVKWQMILAFAGIGIEAAENSDWALSLCATEARIAARHSCYSDQGYPDWFDNLLTAYPKLVNPILRKEIAQQWREGVRGATDFMWRYGNPSNPVPQPVAQMLLSVFEGSEAANGSELSRGLRVVRNLPLTPPQKISLLKTAHTRMKSHRKAKRYDFVLPYLAMIILLAARRWDRRIHTLFARHSKEATNNTRSRGIGCVV